MIINGFERDEQGNEDKTRLWVDVENLAVHIIQTDEGVVVDIYPLHHKDDFLITSTYAFFDEALTDEDL